MPKEIKMLLQNEWEFYDVKKMRKKKSIIVSILIVILWGIFYFLINLFIDNMDPEYNTFPIKAIITTIILFIVMIIIVMKVRQMDQEKKDWYFSALQDKSLNREEILMMVRDFLYRHNYIFNEEETHRTMTLWITYFTISTVDFKVRVWFTTIAGLPTVEIGFGPETPLNRKTIVRLKSELSQEFQMRYGFPQPTGHL